MENSWLFKLMWVILSRFGMANKSEAGREMINRSALSRQSYIRHISQIFVFIFKDLSSQFRDAKRFSAQWHGVARLKTAQISYGAIAFRFARRVLSICLQHMAERRFALYACVPNTEELARRSPTIFRQLPD